MRKRKLKKGLAWILACALFMGMTPVNTQAKEQKNREIVLFNANVTSGGSVTGGAATIEPTAEPKEIVTVTPFSGLWKYYGQKRTFIRDVHYAVSDEKDLPDGVTLTISSETAGKQQFVLKDERSSDEKQKISYQLAKNAPAYEIRAYHTNAVAKTEKDTINIADRTGLTDDKVEIEAPAGYRISSQASVDANWADTMSVTLTEGKNEIAYYLASKQADATKNAIDTTKKTITIVADFTAPQITSVSGFDSDTDTTSSGLITGNEPGKFYYVVLPKALGEEAEKESGGMTTKFILSRVTSHYGIVGYGRVDGAKASNFSFNGLAAETEYVIYSFMTDDAGNESAVAKSAVFTTDKMAIAGSVEITGTPAIDETLTAKPSLDSVVLLLVGTMLLMVLVFGPLVIFLYLHRNPYPLVYRCFKESGLTAFFTRSSAANIPVNMQLCEKLGLDKDMYSVSIPLGATINMNGAAITITIMAMAAANTMGIQISLPAG